MSNEMTVPGTTDWPYALCRLPVMDGLRGLYIFGNSLELSMRNHAPGGPPLRRVGAPVINANHIRLTGGASWLETDLTEATLTTMLAVAKMPVAPSTISNAGMLLGNYAGASVSTQGTSLYLGDSGGDIARFITTLDNGGAAVSAAGQITAAAPTTWGLYVGRSTALATVWDETNSASHSSVPFPYARAAPTANKLRIGDGYTAFDGVLDAALVLEYGRGISDTELAQVITRVRALMTARGITV